VKTVENHKMSGWSISQRRLERAYPSYNKSDHFNEAAWSRLIL